MTLAGLIEQFSTGLATPLTALCVIPLYPAYIAYLANIEATNASFTRGRPLLLGVLVMAGVLTFMGGVGVVFAFILQGSVAGIVEVVSPIAFVMLLIIGGILIVDQPVFGRLETLEPPNLRYPGTTAFGYGFFFGAIVIPCNPGLIALAFARNPILFDTHVESALGFLAFGLGIGTPLLALALVSESLGTRLTRGLTTYRSSINRATGVLLVAVASYYLLVVFEVVSVPWI